MLLLHRFGIKDYEAIIVDFKLEDAAECRVNICTLNIRRLIGDKSLVAARHNEKAKELIVSCKINRKLDALEDKWDYFDDLHRRMKLDAINE